MSSASAAAASAGGPAVGLMPIHFYVAALGATDLLLQLIEKLLVAPPTAASGPVPVSAPGQAASAPPARPLDVRSQAGVPVLHVAAAHGQLDCVRLLLARGAVPDQLDAHGALPSDHALRGVPGRCAPGEGHAECHLLLLRHLAR